MVRLVFPMGTRQESQHAGRPTRGELMKWQTMKTVLWSAAGGAVVWWIMLSAVLGWMPAGRAEKPGDGVAVECANRILATSHL